MSPLNMLNIKYDIKCYHSGNFDKFLMFSNYEEICINVQDYLSSMIYLKVRIVVSEKYINKSKENII